MRSLFFTLLLCASSSFAVTVRMTSDTLLVATPTNASEAVPKSYADSLVTNIAADHLQVLSNTASIVSIMNTQALVVLQGEALSTTTETHSVWIGSVGASGDVTRAFASAIGGTNTDHIAGVGTAVHGLGSASTNNTVDFATATQGTKADNAMPIAGGTFTGHVYSTDMSDSPSSNELVTAEFARSLVLSFANTTYYNSGLTNTVVTNSEQETFLLTTPDIPVSGSRSYTSGLTNNAYLGITAGTNRINASGNAVVSGWISATSNGGNPSLTLAPEIYASYNGTNWYGDWSTEGRSIMLGGASNQYTFVVPLLGTGITNSYPERKWKIKSVNNIGNITIYFGTNQASSVGFTVASGDTTTKTYVDAQDAANLVAARNAVALTNLTFAWQTTILGPTNGLVGFPVAYPWTSAGTLTRTTVSPMGVTGYVNVLRHDASLGTAGAYDMILTNVVIPPTGVTIDTSTRPVTNMQVIGFSLSGLTSFNATNIIEIKNVVTSP